MAKAKTYKVVEKKTKERYGRIPVMSSIDATLSSMPYIPVSTSGCGAHKTDKNPSRARRKQLDRKEYGI